MEKVYPKWLRGISAPLLDDEWQRRKVLQMPVFVSALMEMAGVRMVQ